MQITQDLIIEIFEYRHGELYWKKPTNTKINVGDIAGSASSDGRIKIQLYGKKYFSSRLIFLYHNGYLPLVVDHENRNPLDNRIENLRAATTAQNCSNRCSARNSSSTYLGVNLHSNKKAWECAISINNKRTYIGYFKLEKDAALAYNKEAVKLFGEFANLNIIK